MMSKNPKYKVNLMNRKKIVTSETNPYNTNRVLT